MFCYVYTSVFLQVLLYAVSVSDILWLRNHLLFQAARLLLRRYRSPTSSLQWTLTASALTPP